MADLNITRRLLTEVDRDPSISQRRLSEELGISVGMVNWHVKRCVGKGLIKLQHIPARRYLYYLTPDGFTEKSRLTANFLRATFDLFRVGRQQYEALFNLCVANAWQDVILLGDSELAELALMVLSRVDNVTAHCILDGHASSTERSSLVVVKDVPGARQILNGRRIDALVATHFEINADGRFDLPAYREQFHMSEKQILIPEFLNQAG